MALCTSKTRPAEFPKSLGLSTPRGHSLSLTDMGPEFADADARYVLTVDESVQSFADPKAAHGAWQEAFSTCLGATQPAEDLALAM